MFDEEGKKQVIYEFLAFLETRGFRVLKLVPEKRGLFNVAQAEKYKLVDKFLEQ